MSTSRELAATVKGRARCTAMAGRGRMGIGQCVRYAQPGSATCRQHSPEYEAEKRAAWNARHERDVAQRKAQYELRDARAWAAGVLVRWDGSPPGASTYKALRDARKRLLQATERLDETTEARRAAGDL